jgi:hypothetical protein
MALPQYILDRPGNMDVAPNQDLVLGYGLALPQLDQYKKGIHH